MHKQKGMTAIGWIVVLAIGLVFMMAVMRLGPVYLEYMRVSSVMRDLPLHMKEQPKVNPTEIKKYIDRRFNIENVNIVDSKDLSIDRDDEFYLTQFKYDHQVPFMANVGFIVSFESNAKVKR